MSERLELNEEQAKALKEWWRSAKLRNGKPECGAEDNERRLRDAIRPLFEPWRVEERAAEECVVGPHGMKIVVTGFGFQQMHKKIAAWLNAAERGEPS